jgi:hypothetical protein
VYAPNYLAVILKHYQSNKLMNLFKNHKEKEAATASNARTAPMASTYVVGFLFPERISNKPSTAAAQRRAR